MFSLFILFLFPFQKIDSLVPCNQCIHFDPSLFHSNFEPPRCKKFGKRNLITGQMDYETAISCRNNSKKCGIRGKYFHKDDWFQCKMTLHYAYLKIPDLILFSIIALTLIKLNQPDIFDLIQNG